jgi:hypothetical protein
MVWNACMQWEAKCQRLFERAFGVENFISQIRARKSNVILDVIGVDTRLQEKRIWMS